jgi:hypothetical protein
LLAGIPLCTSFIRREPDFLAAGSSRVTHFGGYPLVGYQLADNPRKDLELGAWVFYWAAVYPNLPERLL